jgi:predicted nucleic acid-binding protein
MSNEQGAVTMRAIRVYADTSVFGGVFDKEFDTASKTFFDQVVAGQFQLVTSDVVQRELQNAPPKVSDFFDNLLPKAEICPVSVEALDLQQAYLQANIVSDKYALDALHVALATISDCLILVSWNFKHIVHFDKIPLYNAINIGRGYKPIAIHSPAEVITYEKNF